MTARTGKGGSVPGLLYRVRKGASRAAGSVPLGFWTAIEGPGNPSATKTGILPRQSASSLRFSASLRATITFPPSGNRKCRPTLSRESSAGSGSGECANRSRTFAAKIRSVRRQPPAGQG